MNGRQALTCVTVFRCHLSCGRGVRLVRRAPPTLPEPASEQSPSREAPRACGLQTAPFRPPEPLSPPPPAPSAGPSSTLTCGVRPSPRARGWKLGLGGFTACNSHDARTAGSQWVRVSGDPAHPGGPLARSARSPSCALALGSSPPAAPFPWPDSLATIHLRSSEKSSPTRHAQRRSLTLDRAIYTLTGTARSRRRIAIFVPFVNGS